MFGKVLIANRGAIACRVIRTLQRMKIASVAVYSEADAQSLHVAAADEAVCIGPGPAAESYLRVDRILDATRATGAQAIHPGYGFLSENPEFAATCEGAGVVFVGPSVEQMRAFGLKHTARALAARHGVPLLPGSPLLDELADAQAEAARIGYPVMLKSTAGGGGIGMRLIHCAGELGDAFEAVGRLARANFKDAGLYLERYVERARHIEVQIFGDGRGNVVALGERDCSMQRRNQKVIEETPAPGLEHEVRAQLHEAAVRLAQAVDYCNAGTVEFVLDAASGAFYFLEVNTRLQVEHGVTEAVSGIDLVEWMLRAAAGELDLRGFVARRHGVSIQARIYAEDPAKAFQPSSGLLTQAEFPADVRVETWVQRGVEVPPHYDPMLAKLIVAAPTRDAAVRELRSALERTRIAGIAANVEYLRQAVAEPVFGEGRALTRTLGELRYRPRTLEVLDGGVHTTIQDWPGRLGYWHVGVPPSGAMDALAVRLANRLLGNPEGAAALECTATGPALQFHCDATIAICGADMQAEYDGVPLGLWRAHRVQANSVVRLGPVRGSGLRTYIAIAGGFDVPDYLGSKATFTLGKFGGHAGRTLRAGDVLHVGDAAGEVPRAVLPETLVPCYAENWEIGVLYGPHGAPDFFTEQDIDDLFGVDWEVHYNSSRTGVRLIGPKPRWARRDGGEAGLHPSNIHDNAYAIGAIDFTGDMPIILGPDGPSLGGFVCPAVIVETELWKVGQLRPGNRVRFVPVNQSWASAAEATASATLRSLAAPRAGPALHAPVRGEPVLHRIAGTGSRCAVVYRQSGDKWLLVEYGELKLDLNLRLRAHALMQWLQAQRLSGIIDLTPGIRSLQVHFDNRVLPLRALLDTLIAAEAQLPAVGDMRIASRIVHLPLSWDDPATQQAIERYMQSVRRDAPWCPSNIEFIRRINGLDSIEDVRRIVFDASYLVLGLGDVYLGAPVATPIDPRHRLVTTKYNPARTWTPENAVGIGGAYLCVYGMEGPGGYQFVGRTVQMWNSYRTTVEFEGGTPWLLRFFDQICFFPVSERELLKLRAEFPLGRYRLRIEETTFSLSEYNRFLEANAPSIDAFKHSQQSAFDAERERWRAAGQAEYDADTEVSESSAVADLPDNARAVATPVSGIVWKVPATLGSAVDKGEVLVIVESMKMEINVLAPCAGKVAQIYCQPGSTVSAGQRLIALEC